MMWSVVVVVVVVVGMIGCHSETTYLLHKRTGFVFECSVCKDGIQQSDRTKSNDSMKEASCHVSMYAVRSSMGSVCCAASV